VGLAVLSLGLVACASVDPPGAELSLPPASSPSASSPSASPSDGSDIPDQVGVYTFGGGNESLAAPAVGAPRPALRIDRAEAIAGASRGGVLAMTFANNSPIVVYGLYTGPQAKAEPVVDVRFVNVYDEVGPVGGVYSGDATPPPQPHGQVDINILVDPGTGGYLSETDEGDASSPPAD
jgi:hypothetical protein